MARALPYRARPPPAVAAILAETPYTRIYVLREPGPTSFVVRGDASPRKCAPPTHTAWRQFAPLTRCGMGPRFKVSIGEQHACSCHTNQELCEHIIFVLVRVFRMPVENPLVWQLSLTEREIAELMRGRVRDPV